MTIVLMTHGLDFFTRLLLSPPPPPAASRASRNTADANGSFEERLGLAPSSWSQALRSMNLVQNTDEFQLALVKVAIACLDATNFVGLANEVAFVRANALVSEGESEDDGASLHGGLLGEGGFSLFLGLDELDTGDVDREQERRLRRERRRNAGRRNGERDGDGLRARPSITLSPNDVDISQPSTSSYQSAGASNSTRLRVHRGVRSRSSTPLPSQPTNLGGLSSSREIRRVTTFQSTADTGSASSGQTSSERGIIPGLGGYWLEAFSRPELRRLARTAGLFWTGMWIWIMGRLAGAWMVITGRRKRDTGNSSSRRAGKEGKKGKEGKAGFEDESAFLRGMIALAPCFV